MENKQLLVGIWKLFSYEVEIKESGEFFYPLGESPTGFICITENNHVMVTLTGEDRKPASSSEDSAELLNSLVSYAGTYRIEGDEWITSVQVAWKPDWVNTEQRRQFEIKDNRLRVLTTWRVMPNWADKGLQRSILTFVKTD
jgi:Lipocalin-like domain